MTVSKKFSISFSAAYCGRYDRMCLKNKIDQTSGRYATPPVCATFILNGQACFISVEKRAEHRDKFTVIGSASMRRAL
jgi:hypothetical protein